MFNRAISSSEILIPFGYELTLRSAWIVNPLLVWVLAIRLTITSRVSKGRPRQLSVMWQNIRCSILFHLLVPLGKWHTAISSPPSLANFSHSTFHRRHRLPFEPPPSAVISNRRALG